MGYAGAHAGPRVISHMSIPSAKSRLGLAEDRRPTDILLIR
jgi:hypothetical protein